MEARIIGDAVNEFGVRLVTYQLRMHRYVLAEFNTHRVISRNAASSRAIPTRKLLKRVLEEPAYPLSWGKNKKGMVADEELSGVRLWLAKVLWGVGHRVAVMVAYGESLLGLHKQVANRVLEPYMWVDVIASATDWESFFRLRCNHDAQPEIQQLAKRMRELYQESNPVKLKAGDWYIPPCYDVGVKYPLDTRIKAAVGKMARVSYLTHEGKADVGADVDLFNRLVKASPPHLSPLEHVALVSCFPLSTERRGNFGKGWLQLRKIVEQGKEHEPSIGDLGVVLS